MSEKPSLLNHIDAALQACCDALLEAQLAGFEPGGTPGGELSQVVAVLRSAVIGLRALGSGGDASVVAGGFVLGRRRAWIPRPRVQPNPPLTA